MMISVSVSFGSPGDAGRTSDGRPVLLGNGPLDLSGLPVLLDHDWDRQVGTVSAPTLWKLRGGAVEHGAHLLLHAAHLPAGLLPALRLGKVRASLGAATAGASPVALDRATTIGEVTLLTGGAPGLPGAVAWLDGDTPRDRAHQEFARLAASGGRFTL